jgi:hypothetical protein
MPTSAAITLSIAAVVALALVAALGWAAGHRRGRRSTPLGGATAEDVLIVQAERLNAAELAARLPAVAALEQHAQATPWHRPAVVELLTGYLRQPPHGDDMVRRAAQRVVTAHLSPTHGDLYWADLDLDLDGAELRDLDLTGAAVRRISARRSKLHGGTKTWSQNLGCVAA